MENFTPPAFYPKVSFLADGSWRSDSNQRGDGLRSAVELSVVVWLGLWGVECGVNGRCVGLVT